MATLFVVRGVDRIGLSVAKLQEPENFFADKVSSYLGSFYSSVAAAIAFTIAAVMIGFGFFC